MKIVYLAILLFLLNCSISHAQQAALTIGLGKPLTAHLATDVVGSPYLIEKFQNSEVITLGGHTLKNVPLRYNIYNQTIECMVNGQTADVTDSVVRFIYTDSLTQVNTFIKSAFYSKSGKIFYYKLLVKGNASLLKSYEAEVTSDEDWYTKKITKKYVFKSDYFLFTDNKLTKLGTSKKSFIMAFNNNPTVKEQLDKNTPDFKDESSLINFFLVLNNTPL